ncbi:MAG: putative capsular polysaccharide synthesis family protein [Cyanobacteria bacterium J06627_28]
MVRSKLSLAMRNALFEPRVQLLTQLYQPVFIWTMGKVGSTSIAKALQSVRGISVFTSHFMNDDEHPRSRVLYKHLIEPKKPLKIISLVRDPISKNVSSFFQNYEKNTGRSYAQDDLSLDELSDLFFNRYQHHQSPLSWFDNYVKRYTGIDVYAQQFPTDTKAYTLNHENFDLLVMRCDLDDTRKAQQVERFLGFVPNSFSITSQNVGAQKDYSKTYKAFKQHIQLPDSYLEEMATSQYFRHFYTAKEIDRSIIQWRTYRNPKNELAA